MLLRRLTTHVEDQNWFAVVLDFLIVVFGVFIGIQVGNLNENRQQSAVYDEAFDRAVVEMQANLVGQKWAADGIRTELPIIQRAIADLQACRTDADAVNNIKAALLPLMNPYLLQVEDDALGHLIGNDDFLKYQSSPQREALTRLYRSIKYLRIIESYSQKSLQESSSTGLPTLQFGAVTATDLNDYVDFIVEENPLSIPYYREVILPEALPDLCGDTEFLSWLYNWETHAYHIAVSEGRLTQALERTLIALKQPLTTSTDASR